MSKCYQKNENQKNAFLGHFRFFMVIICLETPTKSSFAFILRSQPGLYHQWFTRYGFEILAFFHLSLLRISPQHRYIVQTSLLSFSFLLSFFLHFSLFTSYFFQSFFSSVLLSLSFTFYLPPLSFFAYPLLSLSVFLCLSAIFFLTAFFLFLSC